MQSSLIDKLNAVTSSLDEAELDNFKLLLGLAAGGLAPEGDVPENGIKAEAFKTILNCLAHIQPNGIVWRGRPDFMTDDLLFQLQKEASQRYESATRCDQHYLGCGGPLANQIALSVPLNDLVNQKTGLVMTPTGIASYIYYNGVGCGLAPHVDTQIFTMNVILMLRHLYDNDKTLSHLLIYPVNEPPQRILLEPGEMLLLFAGGTVHGREYLEKGEVVHILTFGFLPMK